MSVKGDNNGFYTPKGYLMMDPVPMTESMEDYIEMISRITSEDGFVRIHELAGRIHVTPSSASKMVTKLMRMGLVSFPKYGVIQLTDSGRTVGSYLLWRHYTLERFLCVLNRSDDETREAEQIEHFVSEQTARNLEKATAFMISMRWKPS